MLCSPASCPMSLDLLLSLPLVLQSPLLQPPLPFSVSDPQGSVFSYPFCTTPTVPEHSHSPPLMGSDQVLGSDFSTELQHSSLVTLSSSNPQIQSYCFLSNLYFLLHSAHQHLFRYPHKKPECYPKFFFHFLSNRSPTTSASTF